MNYQANPSAVQDWFKKHNTPEVKAQMQQWIEALESGKYQQSKNYLQTVRGHCCLGVAVDVCRADYPRNSLGLLLGIMPRAEHGAPEWLVDIAEVRFTTLAGRFILSDLNDMQNLSFKTIASVLRENFLRKMEGVC